jgi:hypothetical protein
MCRNKLVRKILHAELQENGENRSKLRPIFVGDEVEIDEIGSYESNMDK